MSLGGTTAEVLGDILKKDADFRVIMVALNAMNTHLGSETSLKTMRNVGYFDPEGAKRLYLAWNEASIRSALESYGEHAEMYEKVEGFYDTESKRSMQGRLTTKFLTVGERFALSFLCVPIKCCRQMVD